MLAFPPAQPGAAGTEPRGGGAARGSRPVTVVGMGDDRLDLLSPEARQALAEAEVVVGPRRQLWLWQSWSGRAAVGPDGRPPEALEVEGDLDELARTVRQRAVEGQRRVCVLAPGDPGFFGLLPALLRLLDRRLVRVLPAASAVSLAFARLAIPWDDAIVLQTAGRPLAEVAGEARVARKAAVLCGPGSPPEALGRALVEAGAAMDLVAVCSALGSEAEQVLELSVTQLAEGTYDPGSVVVLVGPGGLPLVGWGADSRHPDATEAAVRASTELQAVVAAKLELPAAGVLWCVGADAGEVAIQSALSRRGLTVLAVTASAEAGGSTSLDAVAAGTAVHVVTGADPEVLDELPGPDRVYLGEPPDALLEAALRRLRPQGAMVATFRSLEGASGAAEHLGNLLQLGLATGTRLDGGGWALDPRPPVFVTWGPTGPSGS